MPPKRKTATSSGETNKRQRTAAPGTPAPAGEAQLPSSKGGGGDGDEEELQRDDGEKVAHGALEELFLKGAREFKAALAREETAPGPDTVSFEDAQGLCKVVEYEKKFWAEEDEKEVQDRWDQSPLKKAIADHSAKGRAACGELLALWKYTIQIYQCLPTGIIGGRYSLCVDASKSQQSMLNDSPLWSAPFCKALVRIMAHPIFLGQGGVGNAEALAATLQVAVIARTADVRPWRLPDVPLDSFFAALRAVLEKEVEKSKFGGIGAKMKCWNMVIQARVNTGDQSPFSQLFGLILASHKERHSLMIPESVARRPYVLTGEDLSCIEAALNGLVTNASQFKFTVCTYYAIATEGKKLGKGKNQYTAPSLDELHKLLVGGVISSWRATVIGERKMATTMEEPNGMGMIHEQNEHPASGNDRGDGEDQGDEGARGAEGDWGNEGGEEAASDPSSRAPGPWDELGWFASAFQSGNPEPIRLLPEGTRVLGYTPSYNGRKARNFLSLMTL